MKLLLELFFSFLKIGAVTIGGGLAMLPAIHNIVVDKKAWLNDEEIVDCYAICQSLPGVLAVNAAIYIGNKKKGLTGAIAAGIGVILPSFCTIILIMLFLGQVENSPYVQGALEGIKAASAALIAVAAWKMGKKVLKSKVDVFIAVAAFLLIFAAGVSAIWGILFGGVTGYLNYVIRRRKGVSQ